MRTLTELRKKTGLSQYQLADYLDISRSLVNMAEKNLRDLPKEAILKIAQLEKLLAVIEASARPLPLAPDNNQTKKIKDYHDHKHEDHLLKARVLQRRLKASLLSHQQSEVKVRLVNELIKNTKTSPQKTDDHWLKYHDYKGRKKILKDTAGIEKLTIDIEVQLGYAKVHEEILKKYFKVSNDKAK